MGSTDRSGRPRIYVLQNGPFHLDDNPVDLVRDAQGDVIPVRPGAVLCRCGRSARQPFCDGTHVKIGFSGEKETDGSRDRRKSYVGRRITIHDNRAVCSHAAYCTDLLPAVFRRYNRPWIDADGAPIDEIIRIVEMCPSGALSYSIDGVEYRDLDRGPRIVVAETGPYEVTGWVELVDVPWHREVSREHYTLCRCGASRNKPFCDGAHWQAGDVFCEKKGAPPVEEANNNTPG